MARIRVEIDIPGLDVEGLQMAVADKDEEFSGEGQGILPDNVRGSDVLAFLFAGHLSVDYSTVIESMSDVHN